MANNFWRSCFKVKNTFIDFEGSQDDMQGVKRYDSEPVAVIASLLGTSFSNMANSNAVNFCVEFDSGIDQSSLDDVALCESHCSPDMEISRKGSAYLEAEMANMGAAEGWNDWVDQQGKSDLQHFCSVTHFGHSVSCDAVVDAIHGSNSNAADQSTKFSSEQDVNDQIGCSKPKSRRRRRRNSLVDIAAKQLKAGGVSDDTQCCPRCGGICQNYFKFCKFCGAAISSAP